MITHNVLIFLKPNAKQERLYLEEGHIRAETTSPPMKGAANLALIRLLSDVLEIPKSQIQIIKGHTSTTKLVQIVGDFPSLDAIYKKMQITHWILWS